MRLFRAALLCLLPTATLADISAYSGNADGCARARGEVAGDGVYLYDGISIERYESKCDITGSSMVGAGAVMLTATCSGEGETWEDYYLLTVMSEEGHYFITQSLPDGSDGEKVEMFKCE